MLVPHLLECLRGLAALSSVVKGLQKWESTVGEALLKLRDYAEKRLEPACQRLHLLLEEVRGWSLL